jgi:hypothetical protein
VFLTLLQALIERLKSLVCAVVTGELELYRVAHEATRKAELLRLAGRFEQEGLPALAQELRQQAALPDSAPRDEEVAHLTPAGPAHQLTHANNPPSRHEATPREVPGKRPGKGSR